MVGCFQLVLSEHRRMAPKLLSLAGVLLCLGSSLTFADSLDSNSAQNSSSLNLTELGESLGIIDQLTTAGLIPFSLFILEEGTDGRIHQYRAEYVPYESETEQPEATAKLLVGALVPIPKPRDLSAVVRHTFFLASKDSSFAATEVKEWSVDKVKKNSVSGKQLERNTKRLQQQLAELKEESLHLAKQLAELRDEAASKVDLDQIVSDRIKKRALSQEITKKEKEAKRLERLVEFGRELEDPEWIDSYRQELTRHLQEAAKVTAVADRLDERRRETAIRSFAQKMKIVENLDNNIDTRALAQEVLQLRKRRRELENRLGITSRDAPSDQF